MGSRIPEGAQNPLWWMPLFEFYGLKITLLMKESRPSPENIESISEVWDSDGAATSWPAGNPTCSTRVQYKHG